MMRLLVIVLLMLMGTGHVWAGPGVALSVPGYSGGLVQSVPYLPVTNVNADLYYASNSGEPLLISSPWRPKTVLTVSVAFSLCSADIALVHAPTGLLCPRPARTTAASQPVPPGLESGGFIFRPPII